VLHEGGAVCLEDATREDLTFLSHYDEPDIVRQQLIALASMPCAGDLMVFGAFDGTRVVNFEDHGGAHGGLGGVQMFPFMISPAGVEHSFEHIQDAVELHPFFSRRYQLAGRVNRVAPEGTSFSDGAGAGNIAAAG
jgi:hypothetical protein